MVDNAKLQRIDKDSVTRKSLKEITGPVSQHLSEFRSFFKDTIKTDVFLLDQVLNYLHRQKGKELRPTLVFMTANLFDGITHRSHIAATMIELLHTATLIHDDVVDEANSRRGFVSINKIWKNKAGVLLGDFLLSRGLLVSLENKEYKLLEVQSKAVQKMSEGELRQLKTAGLFNMTEERYFQIISEKTASLISTCCECGAVSATDDKEMHDLMASIGMCVGIAFQIRDDLFDYGVYDIGKPTRNDIQERKVTLPLIKAMEHASKKEAAYQGFNEKRRKKAKDIDDIVEFVHSSGGMDYAKESMYSYANKAIEGLEKLPESKARLDFVDLIHYVITRKKIMPEQDCIFISDVHLGAFDSIKEQEIESDLIALIKYCCENEIKIFLLGDLFDYWMEYPKKEFIPTHGEKVLNAFKEYNITCKPSTFITGNHDNWTFGHFENIGFDVEPNYRIVKLNGYKVLLMHGDGKFGKRDDLLRPFWHGLLRSSWFIKIFQFLFPPKIGLWIMKRFSGFSKLNDLRTPVPLNNHAKRILKEKDIDHILMGHDHIPRTEIFESGTYINLGTFFHHRSLALYTNKDLKLVTWSASKKEFVPYDKSTAKA